MRLYLLIGLALLVLAGVSLDVVAQQSPSGYAAETEPAAECNERLLGTLIGLLTGFILTLVFTFGWFTWQLHRAWNYSRRYSNEVEKLLEELSNLRWERDWEKISQALQEQEETTSDLKGLLTPREQEVLRLMAADMTYPQIAEALTISLETVNTHVKNLRGKLEAANKDQAVEKARKLGLLENPPKITPEG